jgi:transcriptional regulator with GAF, ATPase, and Fis domain
MSAVEFMFTTLLIIVCAVTHRARDRYFVSQPDTYNKIMLGLGLWLAMMLVRAAAAAEIVPAGMIGEGGIYQSLAEALLLVAGGIFLAVGISEWLRRLAAASISVGDPKVKAAVDVFPSLALEMVTAERLSDQIYMIDRALRDRIGYDILRIALYDARGWNVTQYCVGQGKNLLTERDKSISTHETMLERIFREPQVIHEKRLPDSELADDRWLAACGASSAVTIPLLVGERTVAAVTFAAAENDLVVATSAAFVIALRGTLAPMIQAETLQADLIAYNRRILDITSAIKQLVSSDDNNKALAAIVETVVKKLPTTYGRLWRYDEDAQTLEFVSDAKIRELGDGVSAVSTLYLADAPAHRKALHTSRMVLVNQSDESTVMHEQETRLALLPGLQSALLIPLLAENKPVGLLAIAEMRSWERRSFSLPETLFARGMANLAALTLDLLKRNDNLQLLSGRVHRMREKQTVDRIFTSLPQRLATPLTSIMARSEQLLVGSVNLDPETTKNLRSIRCHTEVILDEIRNLQEAREETLLRI